MVVVCIGWIGGPGGDLLSRALWHSTMGAGDFHGRVRDGIGCGLPAIATRLSNPPVAALAGAVFGCGSWFWCALVLPAPEAIPGRLPPGVFRGACPRVYPEGVLSVVCG